MLLLRRELRPSTCAGFAGLCMSETIREYKAGQLVSARTSVTGILVTTSMPRLLTGSILAHVCTHALLRMSNLGSSELTDFVEEGLCELMAFLYLEQFLQQVGASLPCSTAAGDGVAQAVHGKQPQGVHAARATQSPRHCTLNLVSSCPMCRQGPLSIQRHKNTNILKTILRY